MSGTHPGDVRWRAYGFLRAGDALVEWLSGQHRNDSLTLPILFCYRQCLELALKSVLYGTNRQEKKPFEHVHDLEQLLQEVRASLAREEYGEDSGVDDDLLEPVDDVVMEFHRLGDPKGLSLRYPKDFLPEQQIDLGHLQRTMRDVSERLEYLSEMVNEGADQNATSLTR